MALKKSKLSYLDQGEMAGKLLARQIKKKRNQKFNCQEQLLRFENKMGPLQWTIFKLMMSSNHIILNCNCIGKSPGLDGLPIEFYSQFSNYLLPLFLAMINACFRRGCLPQSLCLASITLLLKKYKDPLHCASYRPISVFNVRLQKNCHGSSTTA